MSASYESPTGLSEEVIVKLPRADLQPGRLGELFQRGVKAVILADDHRVAQLWQGLVGKKGDQTPTKNSVPPHWENGILDTAWNHQNRNMELGDMLWFVPNTYAYIARKMRAYTAADGATLEVAPAYFQSGEQRVMIPEESLRTAWELASDIFVSLLPRQLMPQPYSVKIEILKYPDSLESLERMFALLANASGITRWTRLGQRLDTYKGMAFGPFDHKIMRDIFAFASLIPLLRAILHNRSRFVKAYRYSRMPQDVHVIGGPHVDGTKIFTALASDRDVLRTEIYHNRSWVELPLSTDSLAIFPSEQIDKQLGIAPTLHRVLLTRRDYAQATSRLNVTLSLAVV